MKDTLCSVYFSACGFMPNAGPKKVGKGCGRRDRTPWQSIGEFGKPSCNTKPRSGGDEEDAVCGWLSLNDTAPTRRITETLSGGMLLSLASPMRSGCRTSGWLKKPLTSLQESAYSYGETTHHFSPVFAVQEESGYCSVEACYWIGVQG